MRAVFCWTSPSTIFAGGGEAGGRQALLFVGYKQEERRRKPVNSVDRQRMDEGSWPGLAPLCLLMMR